MLIPTLATNPRKFTVGHSFFVHSAFFNSLASLDGAFLVPQMVSQQTK
jgi:hypothetical protein